MIGTSVNYLFGIMLKTQTTLGPQTPAAAGVRFHPSSSGRRGRVYGLRSWVAVNFTLNGLLPGWMTLVGGGSGGEAVVVMVLLGAFFLQLWVESIYTATRIYRGRRCETSRCSLTRKDLAVRGLTRGWLSCCPCGKLWEVVSMLHVNVWGRLAANSDRFTF